MGFVESINDAFNKGVSGTERLLEVGKLKTKLSTLGKTRTELLTALGSVAYEQFRTSSSSVDALAPLGERIRAVEVDIAQTQSRLDQLEAEGSDHTVRCVQCGHQNPIAARFCVKCGAGIEPAPNGPACASCGTPLADGGKFCVRCGTPAVPSDNGGQESDS